MTLLPEGQGGSIVTIPVNADTTAGFGLQRRPLNEFFDPDAPDELVVAVEDMLSIGIDLSAVVDPAGLETILQQFEAVQVVLPDAVVDSNAVDGTRPTSTVPDDSLPDDSVPDDTVFDVPEGSVPGDSDPGVGSSNDPAVEEVVGVDGIVFSAGPQILGPAEMAEVLTVIDESVPAYEQHSLDVEMWSAIGVYAPLQIPPEPVATDGEGRPVPPASVEELASSLFAGEVGVRDLAATPPSVGTNPTDADVVVLDRSDVASRVRPDLPVVGVHTQHRPEDADRESVQRGPARHDRWAVREQLRSDPRVDRATPLPAGQRRVRRHHRVGRSGPDDRGGRRPRLLEESIRASEILFGPSEVGLATTVVEGVDIVVTLGTPYLEREAGNNDGAAGLVPITPIRPDPSRHG